jgi:hypothetical protein
MVLPVQAVDLLSAFPENMTFVISSPDVKRLQSLDEHAVTKVLSAPELRKAFAPGLKRWEDGLESMEKRWKDDSGFSGKELRELFNGGVAVGFAFDMKALAESTSPGAKLAVTEDVMQGVIMAHFSGDESTAEKVINGFLRGVEGPDKGEKKTGEDAGEKLVFPDDYTSEVHEEQGVKLHLWVPKKQIKGTAPSTWALVDKILILTNGEKTLKGCVERVQRGGASFAESPATKDLVTRVKASDVFAVGRLQPFMKMMEEKGIQTFNDKAESSGGNAPGTPDPVKMFGWLGLSKLETGYLAADFKDAAVNVEFGITFKEKPGVLKLIATAGPGTVPDFLPADATAGSYGTMSLDKMMGTIEEFLADAMPPVNAMVSVKLDEIRRQSGVDIKKDLLGNLGPDYWTVSGLPPGGLGSKSKKREEGEVPGAEEMEAQVFGFRLKDKKAFELAFSSILNWALPGQSLFEANDYQGFTVQQFRGSPLPVGYVMTDDWFLFFGGPRVVLEKVLSRMRKGGGGAHLFSQAHVASAVKALPEGGNGTSYTDLSVLLGALAELAKQLPGGGEPNRFIDFEALPDDLKLPLALSSRFFSEEGGMRVHMHIEEKARP